MYSGFLETKESCRIGGGTPSSGSISGTVGGGDIPALEECPDPDGDGWGWTGTESCRAGGDARPSSDITGTPGRGDIAAPGECPDPDGDGWGWTGSRSCKVPTTTDSTPSGTVLPASKYRPADITDLVPVTGQSNALGANSSFDALLDVPHERVFAFTNVGWRTADLHQVWDQDWHPRNHPETDPSNNFAFHFGKRVSGQDSDWIVGFILVTAPGASIANWDYNGKFYVEIRNKVLDAINQLPQKSALDGILWHQGETDAVDSPVYSAKLNALISHFRSENW